MPSMYCSYQSSTTCRDPVWCFVCWCSVHHPSSSTCPRRKPLPKPLASLAVAPRPYCPPHITALYLPVTSTTRCFPHPNPSSSICIEVASPLPHVVACACIYSCEVGRFSILTPEELEMAYRPSNASRRPTARTTFSVFSHARRTRLNIAGQ